MICLPLRLPALARMRGICLTTASCSESSGSSRSKGAVALENGPKEPDQAERAVGKLLFVLPSALRAPVPVVGFEVRPTALRLARDGQMGELRNRRLEQPFQLTERATLLLFRKKGEAFDEIGPGSVALRDVVGSQHALGDLRNDVHVHDAGESIGQIAKLRVLGELLEVRLFAEPRIGLVVGVRSPHHLRTCPEDALVFDERRSAGPSGQRELVFPRSVFQLEIDREVNVTILPVGVQAANPAEASTTLDRARETALRLGDLAQELEGIEEVRLAGGIGAHDALPQGQVDVSKVAPVLELDVAEDEGHPIPLV